jgi:zinc/manganese transport system substrate-binding protein
MISYNQKHPAESRRSAVIRSELPVIDFRIRVAAKTAALALSAFLAPVAFAAGPASAAERIPVVAAENTWGSIVSQIGGERIAVKSVLSDPNADPHEYETNVATAHSFARARYVVINGAGYDSWAQRLLGGDPSASRRVLDVAVLLGKREGVNPHFWYSPEYVERVADQIRDDLSAVDPSGRTYYAARRSRFRAALAPYRAEIAGIRTRYPGRSIGATEDVIGYLTDSLGFKLTTPKAYLQASENGTEPPIAAVREFNRQIRDRSISVLFYNAQTGTASTANQRELAKKVGIPVVTVTETIVPADASFQDWQDAQLRSLRASLAR